MVQEKSKAAPSTKMMPRTDQPSNLGPFEKNASYLRALATHLGDRAIPEEVRMP